MAHAQKPDIVFRRNGWVHLNRRGRQSSQLLAAEVCASAVVILETPCSEVVWRVLATHSIRQFPLHFLSRASPCAITFQMESTKLPKRRDSRYGLTMQIATIYYHKYLYMFRTSICPSSGVQVVYYCIWCSALGVVAVVLRSRCVVLCTVCEFCWIQTYTQCTRLHTGSLGPQPLHLVLKAICSTYNMYSWRWTYRCPKHVELFMIKNHNCCIKLVLLVISIYDARPHIHQICS